jgi:hypothetical protein
MTACSSYGFSHVFGDSPPLPAVANLSEDLTYTGAAKPEARKQAAK